MSTRINVSARATPKESAVRRRPKKGTIEREAEVRERRIELRVERRVHVCIQVHMVATIIVVTQSCTAELLVKRERERSSELSDSR